MSGSGLGVRSAGCLLQVGSWKQVSGRSFGRHCSCVGLRRAEKQDVLHRAQPRCLRLNAAGPGGGVLDRPVTIPTYEPGKDTRKKRPPMYRVMLHNDNFNRREYVVQVLMKVVDGLTMEDAINVMQEAHLNGLALVIQCAQETAEQYCEAMRSAGLISTLEPAGSGGAPQ
ncbi:hypothetical protein WJX72_008894 [[Myrmecia] bisecta]|uniref:Adaptor protein ClpS core domain-containing protein n=1 Tax=[Myrmecia] bisecta TaxID=41462 RepID=A0AAW1PJN7_9CHLO